jgi:hypothetical protein
MKRQITSITTETFYYDDTAVLGYLINGALCLEITDADKENFEGDWSVMRECDVWSFIHNGDGQPVTFSSDFKTYVTYYPRHRDTSEFLRVEFRMVG